jgi:hypothetical protein
LEVEPVMAAFVHRFTQFVDWPEAAFGDGQQMDLCVAGSEQFVQILQRLVNDTDIGGRSLVVRAVSDPAVTSGCHVLFVSSIADRLPSYLSAASGRPILTVSDSPTFLDDGGMIELRIIDRRIRFAVDLQAASEVGLRFSSQLLDLAIEVRGDVQ